MRCRTTRSKLASIAAQVSFCLTLFISGQAITSDDSGSNTNVEQQMEPSISLATLELSRIDGDPVYNVNGDSHGPGIKGLRDSIINLKRLDASIVITTGFERANGITPEGKIEEILETVLPTKKIFFVEKTSGPVLVTRIKWSESPDGRRIDEQRLVNGKELETDQFISLLDETMNLNGTVVIVYDNDIWTGRAKDSRSAFPPWEEHLHRLQTGTQGEVRKISLDLSASVIEGHLKHLFKLLE